MIAVVTEPEFELQVLLLNELFIRLATETQESRLSRATSRDLNRL
jgi:hypothetical protein